MKPPSILLAEHQVELYYRKALKSPLSQLLLILKLFSWLIQT